jgi:hypothetical protein
VEVNFISGRQAVLTILKDGRELEKVILSDYDDKDKLHHLFAIKGFIKYTNEEVAARRKIDEQQKMVGEKHVTYPQYTKMSPRQVEQEMKEKMRELMVARKKFEAGLPMG